MDSRPQLAMALLLCVAVTILYTNFFLRKDTRTPEEQQQAEDGEKSPQGDGEDEGGGPEPSPDQPDPADAEHPKLAEGMGDLHRVEVEGADGRRRYVMKWSERGAVLTSLRLSDYYEEGFDRQEAEPTEEKLLELIRALPGHHGAFAVDAAGLDLEVRRWKRVDDGTDPSLIRFRCRVRSLEVDKEIVLAPDDAGQWKFRIRLVVRNLHEKSGKWTFDLYGPPGIQREAGDRDYILGYQAEGKETHALEEKSIPLTEFEDDEDFPDGARSAKDPEIPLNWVGVANKYFAVCLAVPDPAEPAATFQSLLQGVHQETPLDAAAERPAKNIRPSIEFELQVDGKGSREVDFDVYAGPKEILAHDPRFAELDDYFAVSIAHMLIAILRFLHGLVGNWGVAILLLTVLVKICLFPLSRKSQKSMHVYQQKMKKFQPKLKALQEKYKNDPKNPKMHEEMTALWRQHGINPVPVGGCLPILIQMPILFGLFSALRFAIDLRQAPFLYITDLSQPDRLYELPFRIPFLGPAWESTPWLNLLPIIMIVTWFYQQKLMPKSDDPQIRQQQQMMQYMPVIMGLMFYSVASGLVLYWLLSTAIGIFEQMFIKREIKATEETGGGPVVEETVPGKKARGGKKHKK